MRAYDFLEAKRYKCQLGLQEIGRQAVSSFVSHARIRVHQQTLDQAHNQSDGNAKVRK